jgi:hypothetical protein
MEPVATLFQEGAANGTGNSTRFPMARNICGVTAGIFRSLDERLYS